MNTYILRENALTDDTLYLADNNKVFKGGYVAIIEYYKYLNTQSDKKYTKNFRKMSVLEDYIKKNYKDFKDEWYRG